MNLGRLRTGPAHWLVDLMTGTAIFASLMASCAVDHLSMGRSSMTIAACGNVIDLRRGMTDVTIQTGQLVPVRSPSRSDLLSLVKVTLLAIFESQERPCPRRRYQQKLGKQQDQATKEKLWNVHSTQIPASQARDKRQQKHTRLAR